VNWPEVADATDAGLLEIVGNLAAQSVACPVDRKSPGPSV